MKEFLIKLHKSWTVLFSYLVAGIGVLELNMHMLQESLGSNYGYAFVVVSVISVLLRMKTTTPIKDK